MRKIEHAIASCPGKHLQHRGADGKIFDGRRPQVDHGFFKACHGLHETGIRGIGKSEDLGGQRGVFGSDLR